MYWNAFQLLQLTFPISINYNMRCIETKFKEGGIILVLDKLQHEMYWNSNAYYRKVMRYGINYNMRCIETCLMIALLDWKKGINYNMRCIETVFPDKLLPCKVINYNMRCIETCLQLMVRWHNLDKLQHEMYWNLYCHFLPPWCTSDKLQHEMYWNNVGYDIVAYENKINYNMRCIETVRFLFDFLPARSDKLQHEMYWNQTLQSSVSIGLIDKLQHEMYWNATIPVISLVSSLINYNMRCIETYLLSG